MSLLSCPAFFQKTDPANSAPPEPEAKRILWTIPNFSTSSLAQNKLLTPRQSFRIATPALAWFKMIIENRRVTLRIIVEMLYEIARLSRSRSLIGL
jgi:hypothetical protein